MIPVALPAPPPFRFSCPLSANFKCNHHSSGRINKLITLPIPPPQQHATFPGCQAVFAFDNASNHCSHAADALRVENMNLHPGGKQGMLREAFMHGKGLPQSTPFAQDYYNRELAGKPKGIKRVLKERGLWPERGLVLECPTTHNRPGCNPEGVAAVLAEFLRQRGTFRIRKDACRKRLKHWATVFCFIPSFIASSISLSATGAE